MVGFCLVCFVDVVVVCLFGGSFCLFQKIKCANLGPYVSLQVTEMLVSKLKRLTLRVPGNSTGLLFKTWLPPRVSF